MDPSVATPPNPSLEPPHAADFMQRPPTHHQPASLDGCCATPQSFGPRSVNTSHHPFPGAMMQSCHHGSLHRTPQYASSNQAQIHNTLGRLGGQATPQNVVDARDKVDTCPAPKRHRTHHGAEDGSTQMANRSGPGALVVARGSSRQSCGPSSSSGRPSRELNNHLQSLRLSSSSVDREGRPSVGGISFSSGCNPSMSGAALLHPSSSLASSPQCAYPPASASSPHIDERHASLSLARNFDMMYDHNECSQADTEFSTFVAKRILTEFRELRELGAGQFGHVLLCEEMNSGEYVAIKISSPLHSRELQRARRERDIMNALRGSPHIVHLYNSWEEGKVPQMHLQMQYCPNGNVALFAEKRREVGHAWSEHEVLCFAGQMAIALDAMHSINVVHVDFKPENVLIDGCGQYVLSDFGCCLTLDEQGRPRDHRAQGMTPAPLHRGHTNYFSHCTDTQFSQASQDEGDKRYIASDMMNEKEHYKAGDMFSFGMSLYELMSGCSVPLHGQHYVYLRERTELTELLQAGYSEELVNLVLRLLSKDPTARPTVRDILEFPGLRIDGVALSLQQCSARELSTHLSHGTVPPDVFSYHQTCFEVAHYLMSAVFRDHRNVFPASVRRLWRGPSVSVGTSIAEGTPMRTGMRMSQGPVGHAGQGGNECVTTAFRTPTMRRPE